MSDDVCDIITLAGRFTTNTELREYANKQFIALSKAAEKISRLESEVESLKRQLVYANDQIPTNVAPVIVTPEQDICERQIAVLQAAVLKGAVLTLEEVKILDLLIKNKRLAKEQPTVIDGKPKLDRNNISDAQLLTIAASQPPGTPNG